MVVAFLVLMLLPGHYSVGILFKIYFFSQYLALAFWF